MEVRIRIQRAEKSGTQRIPLLIFIVLSLSIFLILSFLPKEKARDELKADNQAAETTPPLPPPEKEIKEIIQKGATVSDILSKYGFSAADIHKLRTDVKPVYDLAKIKAGQQLRLYVLPDGSITRIEYEIDPENYVVIRKKDGTYRAEKKILPYMSETHIIWGIIEDNLPNAITRAGEQEVLGYELAEIFAWDIDFYTDLRKGDSFKILFEKKFLKGAFAGYGPILAAEFTNQGKTFKALRYTYPDTKKADYFTPHGQSLRKEFLKSPIRYARITSRFSYRRLHPIRKVYRPHYGVDYAANPGTPVQATADGTVVFAGWNGLSGRMIRIRHKNRYETMYLHLRKCFVKKGDKVKGGETIGEVGSSGESTGPHLDYRIKYAGRYINPLAHRFQPVEPLRPEFREDFRLVAAKYELALEAPLVLFSSF